jgi:hypothetical protein
MAVDLTASTDSPRQLIEAKSELVAETDDGLIVWSGKTWVTIPWLTKWLRACLTILIHMFQGIRLINTADQDRSTPADDPPVARVHVMPPFKKFLVA